MLKWVANNGDRKPDFDIDNAKPGQTVKLQIGKNTSFSGRWVYIYTVKVSDAGTIDVPETALSSGTWYARHAVDGGKWGNVVTMTIA